MSRDADPAGHARPTREELEASQKALLESEARLREMNAELARHVTERTAALQASEARLRTIFETSYQYQGLLALDGTLLEANAASLEGIEAGVSDVVGKPFWDTPWFTGTPGMPARCVRLSHSSRAARLYGKSFF
jgi:PAS domain-containing protein